MTETDGDFSSPEATTGTGGSRSQQRHYNMFGLSKYRIRTAVRCYRLASMMTACQVFDLSSTIVSHHVT